MELIYRPGNSDETLLFNKKSNKKQNEKHNLSVVLQILNGKPVVINLRGETLAPLEGRLAVKKNFYRLPDTPIGLLLPVKFPIEIQNVGSSKISYKIEITEKNREGAAINSQFEIFGIGNKEGQLMQNEKQYLYCLFKPLETKTYYHDLKIMVYDFVKEIQTLTLHIEGSGYSRRRQNAKNMLRDVSGEIPRQRSYVSPIGSKVFFSIEEIDFGKLLPGKSQHRMIILYNLSKTNKLTFDFGAANLALGSYGLMW